MSNAEKRNKLAKDVLILSRNTLLVNLRFLEVVIIREKLSNKFLCAAI